MSDDAFARLFDEAAMMDAAAPRDPRDARRAILRRRRAALALAVAVLLVLGSVGAYVAVVLGAALPAATGAVSIPPVTMPSAFTPSVPRAAASALGVTGAPEFAALAGTDGILASSGSTDPLPIASVSKVITALVVLDAHPLAPGEAGPTLRFGEAENDLYDKYYLLGASIQRMPIGSSMSLHDTLETVLVASASNYAEAASTWAFGSPAGFRSAAARWLAAHGLDSTTIVEPTGIDPRNASTATDLVAIGRLAMANPVVAELVGTPILTVPGLDPVTNTNGVLGVDGVDGIKTGTLDEAGACLLFSAVVDVGASTPLSVVGVVLGSSEQFVAGIGARELLASVRAGFHPVKLVSAGEVVGLYTAPWGANSSVDASTAARLLTWSDSPVTSTIEFDPTTSGRAGDEVGSITYTSATDSTTVPLVLDRTIAEPGTWWRLSHPGVMLGWRWPD